MKHIQIFSEIKTEEWQNALPCLFADEYKLNMLKSSDDLISSIIDEIEDNTLIDGGHYSLEQNGEYIIHKPTFLTTLAFEISIKTYRQAISQNKNVALGFLVNDLGLNPESREEIKKETTLHPEYINLLEKNNLNINDINIVFFESNLRNRSAKQVLRNGIKLGMVKEHETLLYVPDLSEKEKAPSFANQVGHKPEEETNNPFVKFIPFCRAIMAQKLSDSEYKGYNKTINFITEHEFKCIGEFAKVYHVMGGANPVVNIVLSGYELFDVAENFYYKNIFRHTGKGYFLNSKRQCFVQIQKYSKVKTNE